MAFKLETVFLHNLWGDQELCLHLSRCVNFEALSSGGWDLWCQIPRKSTAVPNRASSEEMMICGKAEKCKPATASLAGNRVSVAGDPRDRTTADGCV